MPTTKSAASWIVLRRLFDQSLYLSKSKPVWYGAERRWLTEWTMALVVAHKFESEDQARTCAVGLFLQCDAPPGQLEFWKVVW